MANGGGVSILGGTRRAKFGVADIGLAVLVISVVAMMIVPLPTWLLDILLATNLSLSVAILLVVLYVPDALAIATFPTVLLLTTLFRLALNVSSARLILLQADAGEVIRAFGNFVVRGNYVVGAVVFLILTIIQFVVIAKGGERVAEVGARFVLDAMPGKQMAIDAELRSGTIDGNEARRRRRTLARESQFYGSMDGAMKFVKGDVIASLVITVINILGGLTIGVAQKGMPAVMALKRYGLLTIGDGLVSQIPALILSTAAGVLVTRTASEEPDTPLGEEISRQLFGTPKALRVAAIFVLLLAVVPGLPAAPFFVLGAALLLVARSRTRSLAREDQQAITEPTQAPSVTKRGPQFVPMVTPWSVDLSEDLAPLLDDRRSTEGEAPGLRATVLALRDVLFAELGVPLPPPRIRVAPTLPARHVLLALHEVPARLIVIPKDATDDEVPALVGRQLAELLRTRASDFLGMSETQRLLDELEQFAPAVVRNVVPKPISLTLLADVLRRLVEEQVSVRDLRAILEALAMVGGVDKDPLNLAEFVRGQLRRPMTYKLTRGAQLLAVVTMDPMIEDTIRRAVTRTPNGAFLTLPPPAARDVIAAIRRAVTEARAATEGAPPVLLTQPDIRRFVRKLIDVEMPDVSVVSFAELLPEVSLRPVARANLVGIGT
ncbi:MAG TPA: flagellar biosynthesis protein FlhA [Polyangiaceae bacterium]